MAPETHLNRTQHDDAARLKAEQFLSEHGPHLEPVMRLTVIEWLVMWQTTALAPDADERKALVEILDTAYPYTVHGGLPAAADAVIMAGFHRDGPSYTDAANERDAALRRLARVEAGVGDAIEAVATAYYAVEEFAREADDETAGKWFYLAALRKIHRDLLPPAKVALDALRATIVEPTR